MAVFWLVVILSDIVDDGSGTVVVISDATEDNDDSGVGVVIVEFVWIAVVVVVVMETWKCKKHEVVKSNYD